MARRFVLTIGREYGSNGRTIGKKTAELLGVKCYDSELIAMAAKQSGISRNLLDNIDEKAANSLMYSIAVGPSSFHTFPQSFNMPLNDRLFIAQSEIVKEIAERENAVIVGRCSDYALRDCPHAVNIFIGAPYEVRKATIAQRFDISQEKAAEKIVKQEKQRKSYYNYYTGAKWGARVNYHLCIDSSVLGVDGTAELIATLIKSKAD